MSETSQPRVVGRLIIDILDNGYNIEFEGEIDPMRLRMMEVQLRRDYMFKYMRARREAELKRLETEKDAVLAEVALRAEREKAAMQEEKDALERMAVMEKEVAAQREKEAKDRIKIENLRAEAERIRKRRADMEDGGIAMLDPEALEEEAAKIEEAYNTKTEEPEVITNGTATAAE